ncbi:MAG: hypothetical protein ACFFCS_25805 [Candidatus Hodarchaeota archaeon]
MSRQNLSLYLTLFKHPIRFHILRFLLKSHLAVPEAHAKVRKYGWSLSTVIRALDDLEYNEIIEGYLSPENPTGRRGGITKYKIKEEKREYLEEFLKSIDYHQEKAQLFIDAILSSLEGTASELEMMIILALKKYRDDPLYTCKDCSDKNVYTHSMMKGVEGMCVNCGHPLEFLTDQEKDELFSLVLDEFIKKKRWKSLDKQGLKAKLMGELLE